MAGVQEPGFRRACAQASGGRDLRWAQPVRPGGGSRARDRVFPDRTAHMKAPDLRAARVMVVGDVMLDRYWFGEASRISPEAPVPVVLFSKEVDKAGGAANVACNCAALGATTQLLSVIGDDPEGEQLRKLLEAARVRTSFHKDRFIRTTQKLRVLTPRQQLLRIDFETNPSREVLASKLADFKSGLAGCNVKIGRAH